MKICAFLPSVIYIVNNKFVGREGDEQLCLFLVF